MFVYQLLLFFVLLQSHGAADASCDSFASQPVNVSASVSAPLEHRISWETPLNAGGINCSILGYKLLYLDQFSFMAQYAGGSADHLITDTEFVLSGLTKGYSYIYGVYSVNEHGGDATDIARTTAIAVGKFQFVAWAVAAELMFSCRLARCCVICCK